MPGPGRLSDTKRVRATHMLYSHWKPSAVASRLYCSARTIERWDQNIQIYGQIDPPNKLPTGRPRRITPAVKDSLLEYQARYPWAYQDEIAIFLEEEWFTANDQPFPKEQ